jgi:ABC-type uncharacterized transport system substrate-binding protein
MSSLIGRVLLLLMTWLVLASLTVSLAWGLEIQPVQASSTPNAPNLRGSNDNPFRLAVIESRKLSTFEINLNLFKDALDDLGWKNRVVFPPELFLSFEEIDQNDIPETVKNFLYNNDIDLVLTLGTETSLIVTQEKKIGLPTLGISINNPVTAGLVKGKDFSGDPDFTTLVYSQSPGLSVFTVFHQLLKFKNMGLPYNNTIGGRSIAFLEEARQVGRDRGFEIIEYDQIILHGDKALESCQKALDSFVKRKIQAIYLPNYQCFDPLTNDLKPFFKIIYDNNIIVLSSEDKELVKHFGLLGYLFAQSRKSVAEFQAKQAIQILEGKSPGDVLMRGEFKSEYILNMAAAEKLKLDLDITFLSDSDILYVDMDEGLN